jgi:hypothetical protein
VIRPAPRHWALLGVGVIAAVAVCGPVMSSTVAAVTTHNSGPHETIPHEHSPHSSTAHEHLPHTSRALQDIGAFTSTFNAPPPKPGAPIPRSDVARVRIADALPPADQLSAPVVIAAAALLVLGFLLHPFRKARRRRAHSSESSTGPEPAEAEAASSLQEISSPDPEEETVASEASEELVSQSEQA